LNVLDNRQGGEISSQQGFELLARRIDNGQQGRIISAGKLRLDADALGNAGAVVQAPACHRQALPSGEQAGAG
ncbi:hypothetical protein QM304_30470, partial [Pseudomonas aeruginosa]